MSIKIIDIYNSMEKLSSNLDILEKRIRQKTVLRKLHMYIFPLNN